MKSTTPPEVQSNSLHPAVSSPNYLPVNGNATPGDRGDKPVADHREAEGEVNKGSHHGEWKGGGEGSDGSSIMGMMEDGSKDMLDVTSSGEPIADLREAEGDVNKGSCLQDEDKVVVGDGSDGMKSSTGPQVEPAADLREAKGELNREATTASGKESSTGPQVESHLQDENTDNGRLSSGLSLDRSAIASSILSGVSECIIVTDENVKDYLGVPIYNKETLHPYPLPYGVVMGLAWTNAGGATMYVEAHGQIIDCNGYLIEPNRTNIPDNDIKLDVNKKFGTFHGSLKVTGHLGTVMTESSQIALTYCKTFIRKYQPYNIFLDEAQIHIHVPEGATPKDGPSGGITMASALISIACKKRIKKSLAMTGELTISGKILRVGGIKEKLIAAIREDVQNVLLPKGNMPDVDELDESIKNKLNIIFVDTFDDVYHHAFE